MPNWCHNTLTVRGESEALLAFVEKVKTEEQPLTFAAHVPELSEEELAAIDELSMVTCDLCGGTGFRPRTQEEADRLGVHFHEGAVAPDTADEDRKGCNGCLDHSKPWEAGIPGTGRRIEGSGAWYNWRVENWGTKWDASFNGPFMALGSEGADVDATVEAQGSVLTPEIAIYKFDTAWSPPVPWVGSASEQEPDLEFELQFGEPGGDFAGRMRFVAGVTVEEEELEVEDVLAPEEMWF